MARKPASRARAGAKETAAAPPSPPRKERGGTSPWEWAAASVGGIILATLVGFLAYEGLTRPPHPQPDIVAHGEPPVRLVSGTFVVPIRVENLGHVTGAGVTVRGVLRDDKGQVIEESATTFDFVAQHSEETGGLYFAADPGTLVLTLRVEGFTAP